MNRIQKIVYTMACLLIATGAWAGDYTIRLNTPANGTMTSNVTTANHGVPVQLTVTPIDNYYLSALYYEKIVTDIGAAESRRHSSPSFSEKTNIPIQTTQSYINSHYGGTYNISMPPYDIEVTAIFSPCTSITGATLHWDSNSSSTSITYDHALHTANVYLGSSDLTVNADYTIEPNNRTDVGIITPTITGVGTYCGTINDQTIKITQKTLTITPKSGQSKVYGEEDPTFTYTSVGLIAGDAITGALSRVTPENNNAGTYKITQGTLTAGDNYTISFNETVDFTINPKDLTSIALTITLDHDYFNDNGEVQKAEISTIKYGDITLTEGAGNDYTYAYGDGVYGFTDYKTPDIYPITVTFTGNYTGTKTVKYQIRKEVTVNNTDFKWRTFYEPLYNMKVPATGFTAHTVRDVNVNAVELDDRQYIKAGTPMLLFRTGTKDKFKFYPELVEPTDAGVTGWTGLKDYFKNSTRLNLDAEPNVQNETKKIWILKDDVFVRTKTGTIAADKCYLELPSDAYPSLGRQLTLDSNTTGIEQPVSVVTNSGNDVWYTLDGRKMQGMPSQKGIYITNGKKIIIK